MKIKLNLSPINGGPFNCLPAREVELNPEAVCCNNVILPWEFNPHNVRLFVIGHEFGAVGAVWAHCDQDAFDELIDQNLGDWFLVDEADYKAMSDEEKENCTRLGNAGEPCNLDNAWIQTVSFDKARDCQLLCQFAEARGQGSDSLNQ